MKTEKFFIEITDTYGGEANYSWVRRYLVNARTIKGAILKLGRKHGAGWRRDYSTGDMARFNLEGSAICCFVQYSDGSELEQYLNVREI